MVCPKCRGNGYKPKPGLPRHLKNIGEKRYYSTFITRRYVCLNCGHVFLSKEEYFRPVESKGQLTILDDNNEGE